jgi:hypothetical protein
VTATDLLAFDDAKEVVARAPSSTVDDGEIRAMVTAISERLDQACGPIVRRTVTGEVHDGGLGYIRLRLEPVASITTLTEYTTAGVGTVLTAEDFDTAGTYALRPWYVADPPGLWQGKVLRRTTGRGCAWFPRGLNNVVATYEAGRYVDTAAVAATRFAEAARLWLTFQFARRNVGVANVEGYETPTAVYPLTVPAVIRQMLAHDWVEGVAVR